MKKILSVASIAFLLTGCNDTVEKLTEFSKPQLRDLDSSAEDPHEPELAIDREINVSSASKYRATEENRVVFPTVRTLTDVNGRSIDAKILAKKGNMIAIARLPSNQQYVLPLDKLAQADRVSLSSILDGGEFEAFEGPAKRVALPPNRRAVWHSHISNAEKEAANFGIPLLVAVLVNGSSSASDLEKGLAYSREFKSWADRNVALCMIRTDGFKGTESRDSTYNTWVSLQKYGINQSNDSSLVLIDPANSTSKNVPNRGAVSGNRMVAQVEAVIREQSKWLNIAAARAPVRAESPFKVASRPVMSNCGST